jgi:hypothetical protein
MLPSSAKKEESYITANMLNVLNAYVHLLKEIIYLKKYHQSRCSKYLPSTLNIVLKSMDPTIHVAAMAYHTPVM